MVVAKVASETGMDEAPLLAVLRDNLRFCRRRLLLVLAAHESDDLGHRPAATMMSPREQIVHVALAEHAWRSRCTGEPAPEPGPDEPLGVAALGDLLAAERRITDAWLDSLTDADLARPIDDGEGRRLSVAWVICHLARHDAHHAGHLAGLWRIRHPDRPLASGYRNVLETID